MAIKLTKKRHPKFNVPNFGAKNRKRVKESWRKQRGIDNKKRIKKAFAGAEPTIGYRNPDSLRGVRADGKRAVLITNVIDLREFLRNPEAGGKWDVTLAGALSRRKKIELTKLAGEHNVTVTNGVMK